MILTIWERILESKNLKLKFTHLIADNNHRNCDILPTSGSD